MYSLIDIDIQVQSDKCGDGWPDSTWDCLYLLLDIIDVSKYKSLNFTKNNFVTCLKSFKNMITIFKLSYSFLHTTISNFYLQNEHMWFLDCFITKWVPIYLMINDGTIIEKLKYIVAKIPKNGMQFFIHTRGRFVRCKHLAHIRSIFLIYHKLFDRSTA